MNYSKKLEKAQLISSIYDYIAAGIFAIPVLAAWYLNTTLHGAHQLMGASGSYPIFGDFHMLFANLFGGFAIMWSTLRIIKRSPELGMCDGFLRLYYAAVMLLYAFQFETTSILYMFMATELFFGSWQLFLYFSAKREDAEVAQVESMLS